VLDVSSLPLSTIFLLNFGTVLTVVLYVFHFVTAPMVRYTRYKFI